MPLDATPLTEAQPSDDLRVSIAAQFDDAEKAPAETTVSRETPAVEQPTTETQDTRSAEDRARDPKTGQFLAKTEAAPAKKSEAAPVETKPEITAQDDKAKATEKEPSKAPDGPPVSWATEAKTAWATLPPAIHAAVFKREREFSDGIKEKSEVIRRYEGVIAPVAQESARLGVDVATGINALMAAHHRLNQNPRQAILELAQRYNVDLGTNPAPGKASEISPESSGAQSADAFAPALAPILRDLDAIKSYFAEEQRAKGLSTQTVVSEFASSPGHEHFDAVANDIMVLIPQVKGANPAWDHTKILQEAYDRAVWANPTTRTQLIEKRERESEEKRVADAQKRSVNARNAASSVTGSPGGTVRTEQTKDSLREELQAAFAESR